MDDGKVYKIIGIYNTNSQNVCRHYQGKPCKFRAVLNEELKVKYVETNTSFTHERVTLVAIDNGGAMIITTKKAWIFKEIN